MDLHEFRETGHHLIDLLADHLESVEDRPVFPKVEPRQLYELFAESIPQDTADLPAVLAELEKKLLPYIAQVNHPGYFGYITPSPTPVGILADLITSALNQNVALYAIGPSAVALERRTVRWLTDLVGYGDEAGGNLTSGGTMANFIGLKLARDWASGDRAQHEGVRDRWTVYTSEERHVSVDKAVDSIGLGREQLRIVPTDDRFRTSIGALEQAIENDRATGFRPMCILGMGGSTNTGAVDPLRELRRVADHHDMWLHVDAAYGGGMLLSRDYPDILDGIALADSVTIDPHKWFYAPLDAGAILVREERRLTHSFGMRPAYLTDKMDPEEVRYDYFVHGFEQSRRLRALKVWMSLKRYGARQMGAWVDANVGHARRLFELAAQEPDFEAAVEPPMSAVCLRYAPGGAGEEELERLHANVARRVEESGRYWISTTRLKGRTYFRINPVNFRTRTEHVEGLFELLKEESRRRL
ncbi:MAG: aminotransferase class I/II-fold pyridoxal phosphate-dependent enzyme [Gemmatimonadota bacterium]